MTGSDRSAGHTPGGEKSLFLFYCYYYVIYKEPYPQGDICRIGTRIGARIGNRRPTLTPILAPEGKGWEK